MQLMRIGQAGQETPVVVDGERYFDASSAVTEFGGDFGPRFWAEGLPKLQSLVELGQLPPLMPKASGSAHRSPRRRRSSALA